MDRQHPSVAQWSSEDHSSEGMSTFLFSSLIEEHASQENERLGVRRSQTVGGASKDVSEIIEEKLKPILELCSQLAGRARVHMAVPQPHLRSHFSRKLHSNVAGRPT